MRRLLVIAVLLVCVVLLVFRWLSDPAVDVLDERHRAERAGRAVTWVDVAGAGHALLPEQPAVIADALLAFIRSVERAR